MNALPDKAARPPPRARPAPSATMAVLAGIMSVKDAMRLIVKRGQLMTEKCEAGVGGMKAELALSKCL